MKKIWKDEDAITLVRMLFVTLVSVLVIIIGVYSFFFTEDETEPRDDRAWSIKVEGEHYLIKIINVEPESLDEVSWSVLNLTRRIVTWEDPSAETIWMEGDIIDLNFSETDNQSASIAVYDSFYSRHLEGDPSENFNHTLCVIYFDDDSNGKLSNGDFIWVRPIVNGGCAMEDYRFRMCLEKGNNHDELLFPPFP